MPPVAARRAGVLSAAAAVSLAAATLTNVAVTAPAQADAPVRVVTVTVDSVGRPHATPSFTTRSHLLATLAAVRRQPHVVLATVDHRVHATDLQPSPAGRDLLRAVATTTNRMTATATTAPGDLFRRSQWGLDALHAEDAWALHTATGQVVAVVDTGVDAGHPDLAGAVLRGADFRTNESGTRIAPTGDGRADPVGHGTHVAGIVAAIADNGTGVAGLARGATVLPVRVLDASGGGYDSDVANGITWAADHGAGVINLSLGGPDNDSATEAAVAYAQSKGVVVVAAAGNSGEVCDGSNTGECGNQVDYPAAYPGVLAVAAVDDQQQRPSFSESQPYVGVAAPGVDILSTYPRDLAAQEVTPPYVPLSGTSMAAPFVSAAAALVRAERPDLDPAAVVSLLESTATDLESPGRDNDTGYGLVNPLAALTAALPSQAPTAATASMGVLSAASAVSQADGSADATSGGFELNLVGAGAAALGYTSGNPARIAPPLSGVSGFGDVVLATGSSPSGVVLTQCGLPTSATTTMWWDGSAWRRASDTSRSGDCQSVSVTTSSFPNLGSLGHLVIATGSLVSTRVSGSDRMRTAVAASTSAFPLARSANAVVLARADEYPDALAGGPLAALRHGPLLLTDPRVLSTATAAEIKRVLPPGGVVYLLGGDRAVSPAIESQLAKTYAIERIDGSTRYDTAVAIAEHIGDAGAVFEVTGTDYADALSAGAPAAAYGVPVLLTAGRSQSTATASYLRDHADDLRFAIGGVAAAADPDARAVAGKDRYETSAAVATRFFPRPAAVAVATGGGYADGLAAAPAVTGGPVLLVPGRSSALPVATLSYLQASGRAATSVRGFGGTAALSDAQLARVVQAAR
ncbi:MAG: S8 family serine peptidase [Actinomycetes bacterium]